jgi:hypothetical protein
MQNKKEAPMMDSCCGRENARKVLEGNIIRSERRLNALKTLEKAINWDLLSSDQEELLWQYFIVP